ncbi:MAG: ABC transporter permease, partial [Bacteroidales bacterium]|nr:ABC transporter permease [Bacteroidales bacterium]
MILKTLWAHRKQNGFVFAEIILITVLSIYFIDYLVVTNHDRYLCRPAGDFEREHLLIGKIDNSYKEGEEMDSWEATFANIYAVRDRLRALPEVEHAGVAFGFIGEYGDHYFRLSTYSSEADSTRRCGAYSNRFLLHEQYFETQGLTPIEGSPSAAQLSEECPEDGVVISRSVALALFGTDQVVGRRIVEWDFSDQALQENGEAKAMGHYTIAGVLQDFRLRPYERYAYSILKPVTHAGDTGPEMLIRLRPDVDAEAFVSKLSERLN